MDGVINFKLIFMVWILLFCLMQQGTAQEKQNIISKGNSGTFSAKEKENLNPEGSLNQHLHSFKDESDEEISQNVAEPEELPKPESFFGLFWRPAPKYSPPSRRSRPYRPQPYGSRPANPRPRRPIEDRNFYSTLNKYKNYRNNKYMKKKKFGIRTREDVYSIYSEAKPNQRGYATNPKYYPNSHKPIPIWSSIMNTGSGFLKMFNPFSYLRTMTKPVIPRQNHYNFNQYFRRPSNENQMNYYDEAMENILENYSSDYYGNNRLPPYKEDAIVDFKQRHTENQIRTYGDKYQPPFRKNLNKKISSTKNSVDDLNHDYDKYPINYNNDLSFNDGYYEYEDDNHGRLNQPDYNSRVRNQVFDSNRKLNPDVVKHIKDDETMDYLKEFSLRDDLYVGKDGNIYMKDEFTDNSYNFDLYGSTYSEMDQEHKQYYDMTSASQQKIPIYVSIDNVQPKNEENILPQNYPPKVRKKSRHFDYPQSKFALRMFDT